MSFLDTQTLFRNATDRAVLRDHPYALYQQYSEQIDDPGTKRALAEHAINSQAAKVEVLSQRFLPILGDHYWTRQMLSGLDRALHLAGITIEEVERGKTSPANHSKHFTTHYIQHYADSKSLERLSKTMAGLEEVASTETVIAAQKALVTQSIQEEVAKIAVLIEDFLILGEEKKMQKDALLSLHYALQLNGHQLTKDKGITTKELFTQLADQLMAEEEGATLQEIVLNPLEKLLSELLDFEKTKIDSALLENIQEGAYPPLLIAYVETIAQETTLLGEVRGIIAADKSEFEALSQQREQKEDRLIASLTKELDSLLDLIDEDGNLILESDIVHVGSDDHNEKLTNLTMQRVNEAIDSSTKGGIFSMGTFVMRYSKQENPHLFAYITTLASLSGTRDLNSEQVKRQMRQHFNKVQRLAKEKDRLVRAKRKSQKDERLREERNVERAKIRETIQGAANLAAKEKEWGVFRKALNRINFAFSASSSTTK